MARTTDLSWASEALAAAGIEGAHRFGKVILANLGGRAQLVVESRAMKLTVFEAHGDADEVAALARLRDGLGRELVERGWAESRVETQAATASDSSHAPAGEQTSEITWYRAFPSRAAQTEEMDWLARTLA